MAAAPVWLLGKAQETPLTPKPEVCVGEIIRTHFLEDPQIITNAMPALGKCQRNPYP
jgi:hypothetical protein